MELGLTFPLQRFLHRKPPFYGVEPNRRFCWDLHVIDLRGQKSLLAVHCHSRYTFVLFDVSPLQWQDVPGLFEQGLMTSFLSFGFTGAEIDSYLIRAKEYSLTRTHGRREVAFLNRAWEDVLSLDLCLDPDAQEQPFLDSRVNSRTCRCAGFDGLGTAAERVETSIL